MALALLSLLFGLFSHEALARPPIKVAIIDTGFGWNNRGHGAKLCKYGHKDFSADQKYTLNYGTVSSLPVDGNGHGTNIEGLIEKYAQGAKYCIVIIKAFGVLDSNGAPLENSIRAIRYATSLHVDFINYSAGGGESNVEERKAVQAYLDQGGKFVAAAGNNGENLDSFGHSYYPASYDARIVMVGNLNKEGNRQAISNYGSSVNRWEMGDGVSAWDITLTGTSQATAIATGKLIKQRH